MLRSFVLQSSILLVLLTAVPAVAQVLVYDSFNYTVGERIIGQTNPGTGTPWFDPFDSTTGLPGSPTQPGPHNGTTPVDPQIIASGSVGHSGLAAAIGNSLVIPSAPQSNIARFTLPLPSGAGSLNKSNTGDDGLFFSFTLKLSNFAGTIGGPGSVTTLGGFLAGFHSGPFPATEANPNGTQTGMSSTGAYGTQVRIRREVVDGLLTGKYQFGLVKNNSAGISTPVDWDTTRSFGVDDSVLVVGSYQFNGTGEAGTDSGIDDEARLWINPIPGEAVPTPTILSTVGPDVSLAGFYTLRSFWLRSDTAYPGTFLADELRIGQTFADVTPVGPVIDPNGDFNGDGVVDGADYVVWRDNANGAYSPSYYNLWRSNFGLIVGGGSGFETSAIPEPSTLAGLLLLAAMSVLSRARRS